jgi:hypothetical protein
MNIGKSLLALATIAFSSVATTASAEDYTMSGDAWTCKALGALTDMAAHSNDPVASPAIQAEAERAHCLPAINPQTVSVVEFQGKYAYVCEKLQSAVGKINDCNYVLTRDLRDKKGAQVPDHISKGTTPLR